MGLHIYAFKSNLDQESSVFSSTKRFFNIFDIIHIIGPHFCISKHLYTYYIHLLYLFFDPCVHMQVYFEAMRFVSILLDFSRNKMYTWGF